MCHSCLTSKINSVCYTCNQVISLNETKLIVDGKEFHENCFKCKMCSVKLSKIYGSKDGSYFCENCYIENYGKKCAGCSKIILGPGIRFGDACYHKDCFKCFQCLAIIPQPGPVRSIKGSPACEQCYEKQFTESCFVCGQLVEEG